MTSIKVIEVIESHNVVALNMTLKVIIKVIWRSTNFFKRESLFLTQEIIHR